MLTDEEITRLLAEKVMSWPTVRDYATLGEIIIAKQGCIADIAEPGFGGEIHGPRVVAPGGGEWKPLERIEHAWEIWTALRKRGKVRLSAPLEGDPTASVWTAYFEPQELGHPFGPRGTGWPLEVVNESETRAICICALRAVGVEPEGEP